MDASPLALQSSPRLTSLPPLARLHVGERRISRASSADEATLTLLVSVMADDSSGSSSFARSCETPSPSPSTSMVTVLLGDEPSRDAPSSVDAPRPSESPPSAVLLSSSSLGRFVAGGSDDPQSASSPASFSAETLQPTPLAVSEISASPLASASIAPAPSPSPSFPPAGIDVSFVCEGRGGRVVESVSSATLGFSLPSSPPFSFSPAAAGGGGFSSVPPE
mmetsp:Transcript_48160/g.145485  ORF Transcript_48160/g.145485 Transcript_48160/m.145485 type:complete len:221 (-) Transcript_48160:6-668(-)